MPPGPPPGPARSRSPFRNPFVVVFLSGIVTLTALRACWPTTEPPAVLGEVGAWELVAADGTPFGSGDLAGKPYVASFFFTTCPTVCTPMMRSIDVFRKRAGMLGFETLPFVSISVDPERDTPEVLRTYLTRFEDGGSPWHLVTGPSESAVRDVVEGGFLAAMGPRAEHDDGMYDIAHRTDLMLIDGRGRIRGMFELTDDGSRSLFRTVRILDREMPPWSEPTSTSAGPGSPTETSARGSR